MGRSQGHSRWGRKGECEGLGGAMLCSQRLRTFSFPLCSLSSKTYPHYFSISWPCSLCTCCSHFPSIFSPVFLCIRPRMCGFKPEP